MVSAAYYRQQAEALRKLARATGDPDEALAHSLRAVEFDYLAEQTDSTEAQQPSIAPPPAPPSGQDQPAQQQQQVQPKDEE